MTIRLRDIRSALQDHLPDLVPREDRRRRAAVALILQEQRNLTQVFFIQRARHPEDPWSGDLGFPGGRVEPDETPRETAIRETGEEVGLDLVGGECLGRLDDLEGDHLPIVISCFVFHLPSPPLPRLNHEVDRSFWIPLPTLLDRARHGEFRVLFRGQSLQRPAIDLLGPDERVLWGITYRLILNFLKIVGSPLVLPGPAGSGTGRTPR